MTVNKEQICKTAAALCALAVLAGCGAPAQKTRAESETAASQIASNSAGPAAGDAPQAGTIARRPEANTAMWTEGMSAEELLEPDRTGCVDVRGADLSGADLSQAGALLENASFDGRTKWPDTLPEGLDLSKLMELGRDPGLGVRILHEQGITGKGVGIAIIDQTLLTDHQEYKDRLRFYEEYNTAAQQAAQMHGAAVASIALGETAGVAPDALLYYIADDTGTYKDETYTQDMRFYARDIDRFVALNETLAADEKIRVISISLGYMPDTPGAQEMDAAIARARAAGIAVVYVSDSDRMMKNYMGAGRAPYGDPNDPAQRLPGRFWQSALFGGEYTTSRALLVPMDRRTAASPSGTDEYAYYVNGGMSWAIPYIAGLYALACQVDPDVTFEQFTGAAIETAQPLSLLHEGRQYSYGRLVNPAALLGKINGKPVPCWSGACPAT